MRTGAVGVVIQAYLFRSKAMSRISAIAASACGSARAPIWSRTASLLPRKADVDRNFIELMKILLDRGTYPAIATHDPRMIEATKAYAASERSPRTSSSSRCSTESAAICSANSSSEGYRLRLYVPFGKAWYPYYMRRLAERPANVFFILRNLLRK